MLQPLTERKEWKFFSVLPRADASLGAERTVLLLRGILPAAFAIAMGVLVAAVQRSAPLAGPLAIVGTIFVMLQVLSPIHQTLSANLGDRTAAWLYDRLTEACVRPLTSTLPSQGYPRLVNNAHTAAPEHSLAQSQPPVAGYPYL